MKLNNRVAVIKKDLTCFFILFCLVLFASAGPAVADQMVTDVVSEKKLQSGDSNGSGSFLRTMAVGSVPRGSNITGNMTVLNTNGRVFGGTNDIVFDWDGSTNSSESDTDFNMTIVSESSHPFNGFAIDVHHVRVFSEGTYSIETDNAKCGIADIEATGCPGDGGATSITFTVATGQYGLHMLFDWSTTVNIDVVNVWDQDAPFDPAEDAGDLLNNLYTGPAGVTPAPDGHYRFVSIDPEGDGINGIPMIDGPFSGFSANFNFPFDEGDYDHDGVLDFLDNCVEYSNPGQADADGDGVGDRCESLNVVARSEANEPNVSRLHPLYILIALIFIPVFRRLHRFMHA